MKPGDIGPDGKLFWSMYTARSGEKKPYWVTPEKFSELRKRSRKDALAWRNKNLSKANATTTRWRKLNREKARAACRKWYQENKQSTRIPKTTEEKKLVSREINRLRRARKKGADTTKDLLERKIMAHVFDIPGRVKCCCGIALHVDHIIPLAKGGQHCISNLQILPARINLRKGAKLDFPTSCRKQ